jgi:uncharacterized membrane protein YphA (DoxX/SURF4 family)
MRIRDQALILQDLWRLAREGDGKALGVFAIRILAVVVWVLFGLVFKVMGFLPRHREIVAGVLGTDAAAPVTIVVGLAETALGAWFLSGVRPRTCALVQTVAIIAMNTLELRYARSLLLAPIPMVIINATFLSLVWYAAVWNPPQRSTVQDRL